MAFEMTVTNIQVWVSVSAPVGQVIYEVNVVRSSEESVQDMPVFEPENRNSFFSLNAKNGVIRVQRSLAPLLANKGTLARALVILRPLQWKKQFG